MFDYPFRVAICEYHFRRGEVVFRPPYHLYEVLDIISQLSAGLESMDVGECQAIQERNSIEFTNLGRPVAMLTQTRLARIRVGSDKGFWSLRLIPSVEILCSAFVTGRAISINMIPLRCPFCCIWKESASDLDALDWILLLLQSNLPMLVYTPKGVGATRSGGY